MSLPASCAECAFFDTTFTLCRRHGPNPGEVEHEFVHWPKVKPSARCGVGAAVGEQDSPSLIPCQECVHWLQPDGQPVAPEFRQGRPVEWWSRSGYCTRFAPSPSAEESRPVHWRVTHGDEACGDGQGVEVENVEVEEARRELTPA